MSALVVKTTVRGCLVYQVVWERHVGEASSFCRRTVTSMIGTRYVWYGMAVYCCDEGVIVGDIQPQSRCREYTE